jgi:hypothetical protein
MKKKLQTNQKGFAVLMAIIIIGAATLIMAYSSSILSMGELELGYYSQKGSEAFAIADGCMEEALRRLKIDPNYAITVDDNLNLGNGSCIISIDPNGGDLDIIVTGSVDSLKYNKKIKTNITLNGQDITINSWEELSS